MLGMLSINEKEKGIGRAHYMHQSRQEYIRMGEPSSWGFHTNMGTKETFIYCVFIYSSKLHGFHKISNSFRYVRNASMYGGEKLERKDAQGLKNYIYSA